MSQQVYRLNRKDYLSLADNTLNYFEITGRQKEAIRSEDTEKYTDWDESPLQLNGFYVVPFGPCNDIPNQIQEAIYPNSLAPRLQNRKVELLWGQGPYLYREDTDGRKYSRTPVNDKQISDWLKTQNYEELLIKNATDYFYQNAVVSKVYRERGLRISNEGTLAKIEHEDAFFCRLAYSVYSKTKIPTHIVVGNWKDSALPNEYKIYPIFDPEQPLKHRVSLHYASFGSYGMKQYTIPDIYGSIEWIRRSTAIPKIFRALTENSLNIKWHIQSPQKYWDDKRKILQQNCKSQKPPVEYKEQMLEDLKQEILEKLSTLLSGIGNVGKFWHNEYVIELIGSNAKEYGWKIEPIEQKIRDYVEAQLKVSEKADYATVASLGVHSALGNVGADGKSDSGSEQLYALKIHQMTSVNIAELFVCKALNDVIREKFKTDLRIGFYHVNPEREQDKSVNDRTINQNPQNV